MANRPQGEGLEGLTPERLLEMANWYEKEARLFRRDMIEMETGRRIPAGRGLVSLSERHERAAALCRAVANAERWWGRHEIATQKVRIIGGEYVIDYMSDRYGYVSPRRLGEIGRGTTLAAALASLHPEAGVSHD